MGPRMREELLAFVSERGTLLEPDAVEFLLVQRDPIAELDGFLRSCPETPFVVSLEDIRHAGEIAQQALRPRPTLNSDTLPWSRPLPPHCYASERRHQSGVTA